MPNHSENGIHEDPAQLIARLRCRCNILELKLILARMDLEEEKEARTFAEERIEAVGWRLAEYEALFGEAHLLADEDQHPQGVPH